MDLVTGFSCNSAIFSDCILQCLAIDIQEDTTDGMETPYHGKCLDVPLLG